jgi:flavin reductase (DIM6/NTAB) family NADH-FMN oxidoreductase RutF
MWEELDAPPRPELDARDFRNALGAFPTGVCLATALDSAGRPVGLTINSFSSVSLAPPMIQWSLARSATSAPAFRDAEHFAISVLSAEDRDISSHFARSAADKFAGFCHRFAEGRHGIPLLADAVATFECRCCQRYYGGDHILLIGAVEHYAYSPQRAPLVFHRGKYA